MLSGCQLLVSETTAPPAKPRFSASTEINRRALKVRFTIEGQTGPLANAVYLGPNVAITNKHVCDDERFQFSKLVTVSEVEFKIKSKRTAIGEPDLCLVLSEGMDLGLPELEIQNEKILIGTEVKRVGFSYSEPPSLPGVFGLSSSLGTVIHEFDDGAMYGDFVVIGGQSGSGVYSLKELSKGKVLLVGLIFARNLRDGNRGLFVPGSQVLKMIRGQL